MNPSKSSLVAASCLGIVLACAPALAEPVHPSAPIQLAQALERPSRQPDVPFVPTAPEVVDAMLRLANVGKNDVIYDLGSGDGRIVITAAQRFGTRGVGVDINPLRVREARENARRAGVQDKVEFRQQDLFDTNVSQATVVALYLLPDVNMRLRPKLLEQLRPGTRVVSHNYDMGDWRADQTEKVGGHTVYLWTIKEKTASK